MKLGWEIFRNGFRFIGCCINSRSKVDSSNSGISSLRGQFADDVNKDELVAVVTQSLAANNTGGFGCVFKVRVEENGTTPVKPGMGLTFAVKTLNHDGTQGHREWLV